MRMAGARRVEDLICWQLSSELKFRILAVARRAAWKAEQDLRRQIRKSCRSSPALIAEGFGRLPLRGNARFVGQGSRGSRSRSAVHDGTPATNP